MKEVGELARGRMRVSQGCRSTSRIWEVENEGLGMGNLVLPNSLEGA